MAMRRNPVTENSFQPPMDVPRMALKRIFCYWIPSHCATANLKLRLLLGLIHHPRDKEGCPHKQQPPEFRVRVETAAGVIAAQFKVDDIRTTTLKDVKLKVTEHLGPQFPPSSQKLRLSGLERHSLCTYDEIDLEEVVQSTLWVEQKDTESATRAAVCQAVTANNSTKTNEQDSTAMVSSSSAASISSTLRETLKRGGDICLCMTVASPVKWSKLKSHPDIDFTAYDRIIETWGCRPPGIGTVRLTQPGHYFTVNCVSIGSTGSLWVGVISCANIPRKWPECGIYLPEPGNGIVAAWRQGDDQFGIRVEVEVQKMHAETTSTVEGWKEGDNVTVTLVTGQGQSEKEKAPSQMARPRLAFALNGTQFAETDVPPTMPLPWLPLCRLTTGTILEMVGGAGEPMVEQ